MRYTFDQLYKYIIDSNIHYWDRKEELYWLYNISKQWYLTHQLGRPLNIVELGTYTGISALCLCAGISSETTDYKLVTVDDGGITSIDSTDINITINNINRFNKYFDYKIAFVESDDIKYIKFQPDSSIDMLYIDTTHTFEHMTELLNVCFPKLIHGGLLFGHDYSPEQCGVVLSVTDFRKKYDISIIGSGQEHSIWWSLIK